MSDCIFCKIANKEIPTEVVYEDDKLIVFKDIEPQAPVHLLIIPLQHFDSVLEVPEDNDIISHIYAVVNKLAIKYDIADSGFRVVTNCGNDGGQSVQHLHFHVLGGRSLAWPPG